MKAAQFHIELSDEAEVDFEKSYTYYYKDSPKVADTFFTEINLAFERIGQAPNISPIVRESIRRYVVKKFPFVIYYRIISEMIQVIAIFHSSRSPKIWNERI